MNQSKLSHPSSNLSLSVAEADFGTLFVNGKKGEIIGFILEEMGQPQPPILTHCDNSTTTSIVHDTVKKQS